MINEDGKVKLMLMIMVVVMMVLIGDERWYRKRYV